MMLCTIHVLFHTAFGKALLAAKLTVRENATTPPPCRVAHARRRRACMQPPIDSGVDLQRLFRFMRDVDAPLPENLRAAAAADAKEEEEKAKRASGPAPLVPYGFLKLAHADFNTCLAFL